MKIKRFIAPFRQSNNYLLEVYPKFFVGVDLGNLGINLITEFLDKNEGILIGYFLTHAHADHCIGIKEIYDKFKIPIYCSLNCSIEMKSSRKNYSMYSDEIMTFEYDLPVQILSDGETLSLMGCEIKSLQVPGHSPGCMLFEIGSCIFTGDFLMKDYKTPLNLPNSSKFQYQHSMEKIKLEYQNTNYWCYPGHGECFKLNERLI